MTAAHELSVTLWAIRTIEKLGWHASANSGWVYLRPGDALRGRLGLAENAFHLFATLEEATAFARGFNAREQYGKLGKPAVKNAASLRTRAREVR